jgi:hypothetical protein
VVSQSIEGTLYLAAFAAAGFGHLECAKKFYGDFHGAGGRLNFTDRLLKSKLDPRAYDLTWTADNLLRHTVDVGLRGDKPADQVRRER